MRVRALIAAASALALPLTIAAGAEAACTRLAFLVNDYGKEGPTKDAKDLLDKHIAQWTAERGIKKYTTGPKDVTCKLFLDFIVFDEYTCQAEANVCWAGDEPAVQAKAGAPAAAKPTQAAAKTAPASTKATPAAAKAVPATTKAAPATAKATPAAAKTAPAANTKAPAKAAPIATGSVKAPVAPKAPAAAAGAPAAAPVAAPVAPVTTETPKQ